MSIGLQERVMRYITQQGRRNWISSNCDWGREINLEKFLICGARKWYHGEDFCDLKMGYFILGKMNFHCLRIKVIFYCFCFWTTSGIAEGLLLVLPSKIIPERTLLDVRILKPGQIHARKAPDPLYTIILCP